MTDPRIVRTQQDLYQGLDELLSEKPFSEISVSDLCRRAGVGRQTFYRHFDSIGSMLNLHLHATLEEQIRSIEASTSLEKGEDWLLQSARVAFKRVKEEPHIARAILSGEAGSNALASFRDQIIALWDHHPNHPLEGVPPEFVHYATAYYAGAMSAMLQHWLDAGCTPDADTMSRLVAVLSNTTEVDWGAMASAGE